MTRTPPEDPGGFPRLDRVMVLVLVVALSACCPPVLAAGWTYLDTGVQPVLTAHTVGDARFYPGDSFNVTVILTNRGKEPSMQVAPLMAPGLYDPSAALGVTVYPYAGDAPVTLRSLPVVAGNIGSLSQAPVTLRGTVHQNASPGIYRIPLDVTYQYVYAVPMVGADFNTVDMLYRGKNQTLSAMIRVQGEVRPEIVSENATNLVPGTQGYLTTQITNIGYLTGSEVSFGIVPADNATFQMVDQSIYVGTFGPGNTTLLRSRIAIKDHTGPGSYPATLVGQYRDTEGVFRSTPGVPLGIPVGKGALIEIPKTTITINPGQKKTIEIPFTNTGDAPARSAAARIVGNQVLVPLTDSYMVGDLAPGETRTATFVISAESAVAGKQYVVNSEVKYYDELGALMLSDQLSFGVAAQNPTGLAVVTQNPVILIIIAGTLVILGYIALEIRKRKALLQE